jgi:hypothetical protein
MAEGDLLQPGDNYKSEIERQLRIQHGVKVFKGVCLKDCPERDKKCDQCIRFSVWKEIQNAKNNSKD